MKSVDASLIHEPPRLVVGTVVTATVPLSAVVMVRGVDCVVWPEPTVPERVAGFAERESFSSVAETETEAVELPLVNPNVPVFEPSVRAEGISVRVIAVAVLVMLPFAGVTCSHEGTFCALKLVVPPDADKESDLAAGAGRPW
jgi:hypothetical protein